MVHYLVMIRINVHEAKTHLSQLLAKVARGESITITKHGVPVARLVPIEGRPKPDIREVIAEIRRFRQERPLGDLEVGGLKDLISEGRRL